MRSSQIVRFNWPFYVAAGLVVACGSPAIAWLSRPSWLRAVLYAGVGTVGFWFVASLAASWIVYDGSRLMDWDWVLQALGFNPASWINIHAGHDDSTLVLRHVFNGAPGRVFDIFDAVEMTEPSIAKARRLAERAREHGGPDAVAAAPERADNPAVCTSTHAVRGRAAFLATASTFTASSRSRRSCASSC